MASFNKIIIVGYLGRDPEIRYLQDGTGTAVCNLSVATTEKRKNKAGVLTEHTTWFRVTVWGRQAETAYEYLARGRQVYIEGRLRQEGYIDRDGNPRTSLEVTANDVHFLGRKEDSPQPDSFDAEQSQPEEEEGIDAASQGKRSKESTRKEEEEEIPF